MPVQQWVTTLEGLDSLRQTDAPMPAPNAGEVLVEVRAVSLNYRDVEGGQPSIEARGTMRTNDAAVTKGEYKHHRTADQNAAIVPCSDMCGVVTKVGSGVTQLAVGDRVLSTFLPDHQTGQVTEKMLAGSIGLPNNGVLTTHRVFPAHGLVKAPSYMSDEEACTLPIAAVTAWMSINGMRPLGQNGGKDEYILVQGTGGVAISGLQIGKASGAKGKLLASCSEQLERSV